MASGGNRWLQFLNNRGRGRSRDQIIETSFFKFFKFSLPHHISSLVDVFNHSFWKLYIKVINDLDPGLNLPENVNKSLSDQVKHPQITAQFKVNYITTAIRLFQ